MIFFALKIYPKHDISMIFHTIILSLSAIFAQKLFRYSDEVHYETVKQDSFIESEDKQAIEQGDSQ